jgi:hypothetical protein
MSADCANFRALMSGAKRDVGAISECCEAPAVEMGADAQGFS